MAGVQSSSSSYLTCGFSSLRFIRIRIGVPSKLTRRKFGASESLTVELAECGANIVFSSPVMVVWSVARVVPRFTELVHTGLCHPEGSTLRLEDHAFGCAAFEVIPPLNRTGGVASLDFGAVCDLQGVRS
jgi:hypothetical protein